MTNDDKSHLEPRQVDNAVNTLPSVKKLLKGVANKQERAEEQIHIRTKAMEETVDGIFIIDVQKPQYPIIYANQSFQEITGFTKREIMGNNYFFLYGASADQRIINEIKQTMKQGKSFHGEMLNFQKGGQKYWSLLRLAPVHDAKGEVTHYVGIQTDLTLIRQRDLENKEQREELLHVTRVGKLAEFVSSLAHEISQPLTAIHSYAQAAQRLLDVREPQVREILQYIINDEQRAAQVIHRLRTLIKKSPPEIKAIDINELIKETITFISVDLLIRKCHINTYFDQSLPQIYGDRVQLQQVILNLVSNSFDAMAQNELPKVIFICTGLIDDERIVVSVRDTGCGISLEQMPKMFTHFFTSKPDGLGMGLSICRSIIEDHGGRISVDGNNDQGATMRFTLPIARKQRF